MEDLDIRLALLNPVTRNRIKELMITTGDYDIMMHIGFGENTAGKLSSTFAVSVQSMSSRLNTLYGKGYLRRKQVKQDSGGYEWHYSNVFEQRSLET